MHRTRVACNRISQREAQDVHYATYHFVVNEECNGEMAGYPCK